MKRMMHMGRIRPECRDEYLRLHNEIPQAVVENYRRHGITEIVCFLDGCDLLILTQYDETKYPASRMQMIRQEAEKTWSELMKPLADPTFKSREFAPVFVMTDHL